MSQPLGSIHGPVTGKAYRPRPIRLGGLGRMTALTVQLLYLALSVGLPLLALLMVSLSSIWTGLFRWHAATLSNFHYVLFNYSLSHALEHSKRDTAVAAR
jgi:hypothetical protein